MTGIGPVSALELEAGEPRRIMHVEAAFPKSPHKRVLDARLFGGHQ